MLPQRGDEAAHGLLERRFIRGDDEQGLVGGSLAGEVLPPLLEREERGGDQGDIVRPNPFQGFSAPCGASCGAVHRLVFSINCRLLALESAT